MWDCVSGVKTKRVNTKVDDYDAPLKVCEAVNSKIISWINKFVTHPIDI